MSNKHLAKSMQFVGLGKTFTEKLKGSISSNTEIDFKNLENVTIVASSPDGIGRITEFKGVDILLDLLNEDSNSRMILIGFVTLDFLREARPEVDVFIGRENITYIRLPFSLIDLARAFDSKDHKVLNPIALTEHVKQRLRYIMHVIYAKDIHNPQNDYEKKSVASGIKEARKIFPSLNSLDDKEVIDFLINSSSDREEVCKGKELSGVFCDIEGTILIDGNFNYKVLDILQSYIERGKEITLWTDGDIGKLSKIVISLGFDFNLKSKSEFAGAVVEVAIDDMDEFAFTALTKIQAKKFIQVK